MTLSEFQTLSYRTANCQGTTRHKMVNFTLGLTGEAGEVSELVKKHVFHGAAFSLDRMEEELGDVLWYVATLATACGVSLEDVAKRNVDKLKLRYPQGFKGANND